MKDGDSTNRETNSITNKKNNIERYKTRSSPPQDMTPAVLSVLVAERMRLDIKISSKLKRATVRMSWSTGAKSAWGTWDTGVNGVHG